MSTQTLASWLRCPNCLSDLEALDGLILGCANGHRFDVNKRGYVSLLDFRSKIVGDSNDMLDARSRVLERGTYAPIVDALAAGVGGRSPVRIFDAGTGTGYYLRSLLETHPTAAGLAMDISPAAVSRAVRSTPMVDGLVADTWSPLPVRDSAADVIVNVFAPRNLVEFQRVLTPDGILLVVVPRSNHLAQLRETGRMLDVPADKAEALIDAASDLFRLTQRTTVEFIVPVDADLIQSLIAMGPAAHHRRDSLTGEDVNSDPADVIVSVDVLTFTAQS